MITLALNYSIGFNVSIIRLIFQLFIALKPVTIATLLNKCKDAN